MLTARIVIVGQYHNGAIHKPLGVIIAPLAGRSTGTPRLDHFAISTVD
jgi:hypothetical protein